MGDIPPTIAPPHAAMIAGEMRRLCLISFILNANGELIMSASSAQVATRDEPEGATPRSEALRLRFFLSALRIG